MPAQTAAAVAPSAASPLDPLFALVRDDFARVDALITEQLASRSSLVEDIAHHIVQAGGKRLRPLIVLLVARAFDWRGDKHIKLAAVIEFLHTATLLHDDVVDKGRRRRGRATANALWGNAPSVLVGDFLYSRGFELMVSLDRMAVMAIISEATNVIAEGEVMQLANIGRLDMDEVEYADVARRKTAMLFQAAAHTGAVLCTDDAEAIAALRRYGLHFGMAYQLVDDWLDYAGDGQVMGKDAGNDLAEGKVTLPLIHTLAHASEEDAGVVRSAVEARAMDRFEEVRASVRRSGGLDYTRRRAIEEARQAGRQTRALPVSPYRDALELLAEVAVGRMD